jgi:hypothetical protein
MSGAAGRPAMRRLSTAALALGVLGVLSGCFPLQPTVPATPSGLSTPRTTAPLAPLVVPAVLAFCPLGAAVHEDGSSHPGDEVFICRGDGRRDTDWVSTYGPWQTAYRVQNPATLLAAYRLSNARISHAGCTYEVQDPLIIWVHHTGVTTAYYAPVDGCGNPTPAARKAYDDATRITLVDVDLGAAHTSKKDTNG